MSQMTDQDILAAWRDRPAPLLPVLHAFHDRDGWLSDDALRVVAKGLRIPLADLFGTVTFYHHFSRTPGGHQAMRICDGPICRHAGAAHFLSQYQADGAVAMPCSGRCDGPVPVLKGNHTLIARSGVLQSEASPLPPAYAGDRGECVFQHIREPERATLAGYGGYQALDRALQLGPEAVLDLVDQSGLAGRGGAGFPTGRKWRAVREAEGNPKTIICNADEGEPGCFKDRALMDHDPHALIEGMVLAAFATGAERGFIYLRYEYPETFHILERALTEARVAGYLGENIAEGFSFQLYLRRGAGAYICGEESSLINSLEGKHPFPRNRPPYPVTHGYEDKPTAVNNVETLASVAPIVRQGADWYRNLGLGDHAGTKVISLSGDIARPGNYEVPIGLPLQTLLNDWAGGPLSGRTIQAVTMAGFSGGFLGGEALQATLDEPCLRGKGSFLGAGGVMVFDDTRDMVAEAHLAMRFFAHESCGKCFPCRIGTQRLSERLSQEAGPRDLTTWRQEVTDLGEVMKSMSACGLGVAAPLISESLLHYFPEQIAARFDGVEV